MRLVQFMGAVALVVALALGMGPLWREVRRVRLPEGWLLVRPPNEVSALLVEGGRVWAGGNDGLSALDAASGAVLESVAGLRQVRALARQADGTLWAGHGAGIEVRRQGRWSRAAGSEGAWPALVVRRDGTVWAGGEVGVARERGGRFERVCRGEELGLGPVTLLFEDREGRLWVASNSTLRGGLVWLDGGGGAHRPEWAGQLPHPSVNAMWQEEEGALWVGTGFGRQGGALRIDGARVSRFDKTAGLAGEMVRAIWEDRPGRVWIGSEYDGLVHGTGRGWRRLTPKEGLAGWEVKAMALDGEGRLWMGTESGVTRMPLPGDVP